MATAFQPEDLFLYQTISELDCVPAAEFAACKVQSINRAQDMPATSIWLVPLDGSPPRPFTSGTSDDMPRWAPDGKRLAFLSSRGSGRQVYLISREGGEARQLSSFASGAMSVEWSRDGQRLLACCTLPVNPELRGENGKQTDPSRSADAPQVVWRLPYKLDGVGYILNTQIHLFSVDANTGEHQQLTEGSYEVRSAQYSPDGSRIVYARTREGRMAHRTDVWIMDADGNNQRQITHDIASVQYPKWSPDGKAIVFTGSAEEGDAQMRLWLCRADKEVVQPLGSEDLEVVSGATVYWTPDASRVLLVAARQGRHEIISIAVPSGEMTYLVTGDRQITRFNFTAQRLVFASEEPRSSNDVYCTDLQGKGETKLTDFNPWWHERTLPQVEYRNFEVPDGKGGSERIDGWLLRPANAQGPTPLLVDAHGGPASYVLLGYNSHVYWPVLVSRGWTVLALNPVGSSSYGREFSSRLREQWGKYDLDQHLAAIALLRKEGLADKRVAITGKSYGGYLTAWAIGNTTEFRAAVVSAPVTDLESHFAISDSGYYSDTYSMCGQLKAQRDRMRELSPMTHVEKARTPTLILQGAADERCPRSQSEELFTALISDTSTPAEMVLYPGGSHHFFESGKPSHRLDMVQRLVEWMERWVDTDISDTRQANDKA